MFKRGRFKHGPINRMKPANPAGLMRYLDNDGGIEQSYVLVIDEINPRQHFQGHGRIDHLAGGGQA